IADADLQTSNLSLNPLWKNRSYSSGEAPEIDGFAASNMLAVRVRDLTALGGVLDRVVGLGANSFNGLNFGLVDMQPAQDDARRAAVADALRKAQLYADAAGVNLGAVISINESGGYGPRPEFLEQSMRASADVPIEAGELEITASVTIVFAIGE
ncbi:SIMPL domain-containing protein, partial [Escherichia coli]|nr:SIMPL domain-containing protein [Escherichia coli]